MEPGSGGKKNAYTSRRLEFERLTRDHIEAMRRTALRMTGSRDAADDLAQETCLKAYVAFDQFETGTNYKAWIFRILTNLCRDYLRRETRSPVTAWDNDEVDAIVANSTQGKNQPDFQLQQGEFYEDAVDAMASLTPELRIIVCLSLLEELTYQEIADVANIPIGTVRSRLSTGRKRLKELLQAHAVISEPQPPGITAKRQPELTMATPLMLMHGKRTEILK